MSFDSECQFLLHSGIQLLYDNLQQVLQEDLMPSILLEVNQEMAELQTNNSLFLEISCQRLYFCVKPQNANRF